MHILINGSTTHTLSPYNRSFQFGDGIFETCRVMNGEIVLWDYHYERLCLGVTRLGLVLDKAALHSELRSLLTHFTHGVLKIIISRGESMRGYGYSDQQALRVLMTSALPESGNIQHMGFCSSGYGLNETLAGIKHQNRLEQILALRSSDNTECIMCDSRGYVISTTSGNVFISTKKGLITPHLQFSGIAGTRRAYIMKHYPVLVKNITKQEVLSADEVFTCNSVYGIRSILSIADVQYTTSYTQTIKQELDL